MNIVLTDTAFTNKFKIYREPPLGLSSIASYLRSKDLNVKVLSPNLEQLTIKKTVREIIKYKPAIVGLSIIDVNAVDAIKLVKCLRKSGYRKLIVLGGFWATLNSYNILKAFPEVDICVRGEGEQTLYEIVRAINRKERFKNILGISYRNGSEIIENDNRPLIQNLDDLPLPARDYTEQVIKMDSPPAIYTGKGCHANCSFCSIKAFYNHCSGPKIRTRNPKKVIDEMEMLIDKFELPYFTIIDDNFIMPGKKGAQFIEEFSREITNRKLEVYFDLMCRVDLIEVALLEKLKSVGLKRVFLGVESGHEDGLKRFNKKITVDKSLKAISILQNLGLEFTVAIILADPWTNSEEFEKNLNFIKKIKHSYDTDKLFLAISSRIVVHKYTAIYEKLRSEGRLLGDWFRGYNYKLNPEIKFPLLMWELLTKKSFSFLRKII